MPEGPEVRRSADQIERAVANQPLSCIFEHPVLKTAAKTFKGATLTGVDTYGKAFVLNFSNAQSIYVHLQLYGRWKTGRLKSYTPSRRTLRFRLETETHYAELYSATDIEVLASKDVLKHNPSKVVLIIEQGYVVSHISRRLNKIRLRDELSALLLANLSLVVYHLLKVLFRSGLMHNRKLGELSKEERTLLARMIPTPLIVRTKLVESPWTMNGSR